MRRFLFIATVLCTGLMTSGASAEPTLIFNTAGAPPYHTQESTGFLDHLMAEIGRRIGYQFIVQSIPAERALVDANEGLADGDAGRVSGIEALYPNLIPIGEPSVTLKFSAFTLNNGIKIDGWDDLDGLSVAYMRGWKIFDLKVPKSARVTVVNDIDQLFSLVLNGRVDVLLYESTQVSAYLKTKDKNGLTSHTLSTMPLHIYVHKKHAGLVNDITKALREIKADGTYKRLFDAL